MTWKGDVQTPGQWDGGDVPGIGIRGIDIPSAGEVGASFLYIHYTPGVDDNVMFNAVFSSYPNGAGIRFYVDEHGRIILQAPDNTYTAQYELYRDGILDTNGPYSLTFEIGV